MSCLEVQKQLFLSFTNSFLEAVAGSEKGYIYMYMYRHLWCHSKAGFPACCYDRAIFSRLRGPSGHRFRSFASSTRPSRVTLVLVLQTVSYRIVETASPSFPCRKRLLRRRCNASDGIATQACSPPSQLSTGAIKLHTAIYLEAKSPQYGQRIHRPPYL